MTIKDITIGHKIIIVLVLAALLPLIVIAYHAVSSSKEALETNALASMDSTVQDVASHIQTFVDMVKWDADFIIGVPSVRGIARARENNGYDEQDKSSYEEWRGRLSMIFANFAMAKPHYYKLRYLDEQGNEMIRVDFKEGKARIAPSTELQNQAKSPYFIETMKLAAGQVYVSSFNLDREGGRVTEPHIPVVRFGIPVFNSAGQRRGILVLNVLGQYLLDFIPKGTSTTLGQFMMVNKEGYYLFNEDKTKTWGMDLNTPNNLFKDMSLANLATTDQQHGTMKDLDGQLMAYSLIYPNANNKSDRWVVVNVAQRATVLSSVARFQRIFYLLAAVALIAALTIGLWLSRTWFVHPLTRILLGLNSFAQGDTSVRLSNLNRDEIGKVAAAFNHMAQQQAESQQREHDQLEELRKAADIQDRVMALREHIVRVASGDLTRRMLVTGNDDLSQLGHNLNMMTENLASIASGTTDAVNVIQSTLNELQGAINNQSSGASEQAAAVNETTAALDQIKGMAAQAMERVQMLGETAERSRRESELGGVAVEQAIAGMAGILHRMEGIAQTILALSEQIQQIGEITGVVTNLAQQSKMLALNASIEAAKAGEAGKGFAVVAAEVRELAEQSQQSTAQVQKILQDIRHATDRAVMATEEGSKGVDAGMLSVQRSGDVMRQLNDVVRETTIASHQITAVVKQQFLGLEQVTNAMKDINKVTTQFVASTQQSKESSADISKVVDRLRDSISIYK
ncbi:MAG: methyl-accepting chemotaxis protein [Gallionella sp.]|nr:methyl-accepting chemotaxis protein [Gallionella sp.]MDD4958293.1 methyl-accepting chemotaxis protein [Gallionella sp.]